MAESIRIIPLGGLGEIGKNMTAIEMDNHAIIIDTGIMFPAHDMYGVDYIIPDYKYLLESKNLKIDAILYTHGHEDHIGAVSHVVESLPNIPIYATQLTAGLIEVKLQEDNLLGKTDIRMFKSGDTIKAGPFTVESFHVCHSIPGCVGFAIHTPYGLIVHTGDYKFDNHPVDGILPDYAKLAEFNRRGVKVMLADSTNATSEGWTPSESVINDAFDRVFSAAKGRVIVATFASLISRIQQVIDAAVKQNRKIAFAGHSMKRNVDMALDYNILRMPSGMMVDINQIDQFPASRIVIMATGAQGEPSSVLSRMAAGRHKLEVNPGDTIVISSHPIPGNEESVSRTINDLFRRGANVIYDPLEQVHVSGHGNREDMRLMLNLIRPQNLVPVHGELRHLIAHANLAVESGMQRENVFVIENGYVINLDERGITIGERIPGGYVYVDGHGVGDIGRAVLRDREILAQDGFVTIIVDVERRNRRVLGNPEIISRGFVYLRDAEQLMEKISNTARVVIKGANGQTRAQLQSDVEGAVSQMLYSETHRRPMVFTVINER